MIWILLKSQNLWLISVFEAILIVHDLDIEIAIF